jgi:hypothetical protein
LCSNQARLLHSGVCWPFPMMGDGPTLEVEVWSDQAFWLINQENLIIIKITIQWYHQRRPMGNQEIYFYANSDHEGIGSDDALRRLQ